VNIWNNDNENVEDEISERMQTWQNEAVENLAQLDSEVRILKSSHANYYDKLNVEINNFRTRLLECPAILLQC
jgi:Mg2+ and Co2+ transporter CorA